MSAQPARLPLPSGSIRWRHDAATVAGPLADPQAQRRVRLPSSSSRSLYLTAALSAWLLLEVVAAPLALAQLQVGALQCRLASGPWQPCRMEVQNIGLHWVLRVGDQRIEFRHSGDGSVRMQKGAGPWQPVTATWQPDTSLCWDGVCAKGDIPLD